ncbi:hypothetical protein [Deinococcus hopiensis]|uniref:hypothetical protein n=1 Tax=Deinococcus hopiensis TaxID=309885 RepID=UPI003CCC09E4
MAAQLHIRQPQASRHLKVLSEAGAAEVQAVANRRACTLRPEPFQAPDDWLNTCRNSRSARTPPALRNRPSGKRESRPFQEASHDQHRRVPHDFQHRSWPAPRP